MNCMTFGVVGVGGGGAPNKHSIFNLNLARHVHGGVGHVSRSSHYGIAVS